jgi:ribulose-phosphate 3-epimerase
MSVNPGFGGQSFLPLVLPKVRALRQMIDASGRSIELEIDGGIGPENARLVTEAGATVLVAGSAIFGQKDRGAAMRQMRSAAAG